MIPCPWCKDLLPASARYCENCGWLFAPSGEKITMPEAIKLAGQTARLAERRTYERYKQEAEANPLAQLEAENQRLREAIAALLVRKPYDEYGVSEFDDYKCVYCEAEPEDGKPFAHKIDCAWEVAVKALSGEVGL